MRLFNPFSPLLLETTCADAPNAAGAKQVEVQMGQSHNKTAVEVQRRAEG